MASVPETYERFFSVWERTGVLSPLRERLELAGLAATAKLRNRRDRWKADRDAACGHRLIHQRFLDRVGYPLNLDDPRSFNEKTQWRKVYDRNPLFPVLADKAGAKEWLKARLGEDLTVPTLFKVTSPLDLPKDIAERELVLKVTHASGANLFIRPGSGRTRGEIIRRIGWLLYRDFGIRLHEWFYAEIDRAIIAEPLLISENGMVPTDMRFHMFGGELGHIRYTFPKRPEDAERIIPGGGLFLDETWTRKPATYLKHANDPPRDLPPRPRHLGRMLEIAKELSSEFDYIRVDFLVSGDKFWIGEMTMCNAGGFKPFSPESYDYELGHKWTLPDVKS